jgi:serine/threonine protein kinase
VYLAEDLREQRQVALKLLKTPLTDRENLKAFLNEARSFRLTRPCIVPLLDMGMSEQDLPFLVMDYLAGGTLRQRYPKGQPVPLEVVVRMTAQVASALQYAHDRHLIHRDVKPENMLSRADESVLLSDFGLVTVAHASSSVNLYQLYGGTLPYMAPEQYEGRPRAASDQYALAVVVYEWLAGARPFQGTGPEIPTGCATSFISSMIWLESILHHGLKGHYSRVSIRKRYF